MMLNAQLKTLQFVRRVNSAANHGYVESECDGVWRKILQFGSMNFYINQLRLARDE